ncbi:MAG: sulfatase-like hydrolase/transferase [Chloroflexi bacterium]|nr:sulfatase-like hydrolase/transferase [Chloroflexota bacterium]MBI3169041.1 sulfatase-like hydrolase/transferase [Chloroflexota bacterium]
MNRNINRRDFLKLAGLASLGMIIPPSVQNIGNRLQGEKKNVLIVVFDALTAYNISLYGYGRETMPNLSRLAKRATVFHNHYAGGNFTTPGTATLLTGTLPWTHRAIRLGGMVKKGMENKSIFHVLDDYYRFSYSHNTLVNILFDQFAASINDYIPKQKLFLFGDSLVRNLFKNDEDTATVAWSRAIKQTEGFSYSLFMTGFYQKYRDQKVGGIVKDYPYGLPNMNIDNYYLLDQGIDYFRGSIADLPKPFFGYLHFLPPHSPYRPRAEFAGAFQHDAFKPLEKPDDIFTDQKTPEFLARSRSYYDEFILNVDHEFGRLFEALESSGVLDDTWVVFTSDHGELFERGIWMHSTPTLYQPIIRVPLLIFEPGVTTGRDVYDHTSAVDLLPTLAHLTGHPIPAWAEGAILPPYGDIANPNQQDRIFAVQAKFNEPTYPLAEVSVAHIRDNYKLLYYLGYDEIMEGEYFRLYDIKADPNELNDLAQTKPETAAEMADIIRRKLDQVNEGYSYQ